MTSRYVTPAFVLLASLSGCGGSSVVNSPLVTNAMTIRPSSVAVLAIDSANAARATYQTVLVTDPGFFGPTLSVRSSPNAVGAFGASIPCGSATQLTGPPNYFGSFTFSVGANAHGMCTMIFSDPRGSFAVLTIAGT